MKHINGATHSLSKVGMAFVVQLMHADYEGEVKHLRKSKGEPVAEFKLRKGDTGICFFLSERCPDYGWSRSRLLFDVTDGESYAFKRGDYPLMTMPDWEVIAKDMVSKVDEVLMRLKAAGLKHEEYIG